MGMSSSDDDRKIFLEHELMETIKKLTPEYDYMVHGMTEDQRIIYEQSLKEKFLKGR